MLSLPVFPNQGSQRFSFEDNGMELLESDIIFTTCDMKVAK